MDVTQFALALAVVAALVVVNAFGDVRDAQGQIIAGAHGPDGRFVDTVAAMSAMPLLGVRWFPQRKEFP